MKIMSFNTQHCLNFIKKEIDFDVMAEAIETCGADIVGLQEMRDKGAGADYTAQVQELSKRTGLGYFYFAKAIEFDGVNPYGNAILSRYPIEEAETIMIPDPVSRKYDGYYETRCVLKAKTGGLTVLVSHFGLNPDEQENAVRTVLESIPEGNCVLMGDFNMTPDNPVLTPIKERLFDTAALMGEEKLSFPSYTPDVKIDYIFTSSDIKVMSADIPAIVASDHRPHTAEIDF